MTFVTTVVAEGTPAEIKSRTVARSLTFAGVWVAVFARVLLVLPEPAPSEAAEGPPPEVGFRRREALEALAGVGRKTANVVLNTAFGEPTIAVDTHIFRVSNRTGIARGKIPRQVEDASCAGSRRTSGAAPTTLAHPARPLRLHGAQAPLRACVLADLCEFEDKTE